MLRDCDMASASGGVEGPLAILAFRGAHLRPSPRQMLRNQDAYILCVGSLLQGQP